MRRARFNRVVEMLAFGLTVLVMMGGSPSVVFAQPSEHPFELEPGSFHFAPSNLRAGAHADWTFSFNFANEPGSTPEASKTYNDLKDAAVDFPAGFTANDKAVPTCTFEQLLGKTIAAECPVASQVGTISFDLDAGEQPQRVTVPLYNMEVTTFGETAALGYRAAVITEVLPVYIRSQDEGITGTNPSIVELGEPHEVSLTIWGVPASPEHDAERGRECFTRGTTFTCEHGGEEVNIPVVPFLANPTSCGSFVAGVKADSWEEPQPAGWLTGPVEPGPLGQTVEGGPIVECARVPFHPSIEAQPTTRAAESATGLNVSLVVPQTWENPGTLATANLKDTTLALPVGMTINPSAGSGLGACTPGEYAAESSSSPPGAGCPPESKIGSILIETPLLADKIEGSVYVATPYENPFSEPGHPSGSLLALYIVAKDPARGILVKVAGQVKLDPVTGQFVTTFANTPQQPFSKFTLKFRPGATAPLVSPPVCGTFNAQAELTPWSAPTEPRLLNSSSFEISQGVRESACPTGGVPPFNPRVISGTQNNNAGSYSPFYLRIVREDGEQELTKFTTIFPPGLTANLTGIPFCPDTAVEAARRRTGQQELHEPSCPATSEIGHTLVGAGVGSVLAWTPGKVYLAGPYHGSALSIVSVTSATVGPFDLGTVVIRFALRINPTTGQAEIDGTGSDPIPHIIDGIVVHVRDIHVYIDRSKFMIDPTSCEHMAISNAITGAGADIASSADDQTVSVTTPFQAADCANLDFKPLFKVTTNGHTSRTQGASLDTKVSYPANSLGTAANIKSVKVDLPRQLPSRLTTLQKACTSKQFEADPAGCPVPSRVGTVVVHTPIVPVPLTGPAYFVSYGAAKFPELIVVLQGYGITIYLHGETFISKKGTTSTTFRSVPDEPFESFELNLPQGPYSALTNNGNLCNAKQVITKTKRVKRKVKGHVKYVKVKVHKTVKGLLMPTALTAQNGIVIHQTNVIGVTGCPKAHKKAKHKKGKKKR